MKHKENDTLLVKLRQQQYTTNKKENSMIHLSLSLSQGELRFICLWAWSVYYYIVKIWECLVIHIAWHWWPNYERWEISESHG